MAQTSQVMLSLNPNIGTRDGTLSADSLKLNISGGKKRAGTTQYGAYNLIGIPQGQLGNGFEISSGVVFNTVTQQQTPQNYGQVVPVTAPFGTTPVGGGEAPFVLSVCGGSVFLAFFGMTQVLSYVNTNGAVTLGQNVTLSIPLINPNFPNYTAGLQNTVIMASSSSSGGAQLWTVAPTTGTMTFVSNYSPTINGLSKSIYYGIVAHPIYPFFVALYLPSLSSTGIPLVVFSYTATGIASSPKWNVSYLGAGTSPSVLYSCFTPSGKYFLIFYSLSSNTQLGVGVYETDSVGNLTYINSYTFSGSSSGWYSQPSWDPTGTYLVFAAGLNVYLYTVSDSGVVNFYNLPIPSNSYNASFNNCAFYGSLLLLIGLGGSDQVVGVATITPSGITFLTGYPQLFTYNLSGSSILNLASLGVGQGGFFVEAYDSVSSTSYGVATSGYLDSGISATAIGVTNPQFDILTCNANGVALLKSSTQMWEFNVNSNTLTQITNGYPSNPTVPGIAQLDETVYIMDTSANIWGSNLNDPTTWTALNFINAYAINDTPVALGRYLNYIVAFKSSSIEFFYDAGNPPPGSPLLPYQPAFSNIGCMAPYSVQNVGQGLLFVGQQGELSCGTGLGVFMISNLQVQKVSTPEVDLVLGRSSLTSVYSGTFYSQGVYTYFLTLADLGVTLAYEIGSQEWGLLSTLTPNALTTCTLSVTASYPNQLSQVTATYPSGGYTVNDGEAVVISNCSTSSVNGQFDVSYISSTSFSFLVNAQLPLGPLSAVSGSIDLQTFTQGIFNAANALSQGGFQTLQGLTDGKLYNIANSFTNDNGAPIEVQVITSPLFTPGTNSRVRVGAVQFIGDKVANQNLMLRYTDNDFQSFSTYQYLPISGNNSRLVRQGSTNRRSYQLRYHGNTPLRLNSLLIDSPERKY